MRRPHPWYPPFRHERERMDHSRGDFGVRFNWACWQGRAATRASSCRRMGWPLCPSCLCDCLTCCRCAIRSSCRRTPSHPCDCRSCCRYAMRNPGSCWWQHHAGPRHSLYWRLAGRRLRFGFWVSPGSSWMRFAPSRWTTGPAGSGWISIWYSCGQRSAVWKTPARSFEADGCLP
jgi:hypothetical protein